MRNSKIITTMESITDLEARVCEARKEMFNEISCKNDIIALTDQAINNVLNSTDSPVLATELGNYSTKNFSDLNQWIEKDKDMYLILVCEEMLSLAKANKARHDQPVDPLAIALAEAELGC